MKTGSKRSLIITAICVIAMLAAAIGLTLVTSSAAEEAPAWVAEYKVDATCGTEGTVLGSFNGSPACVSASSGGLHYCKANFPYFEMQFALYKSFTGYSVTVDSLAATINTNVYMTENEAKNITYVALTANTRSKNETPTLQGIQYFTNLTYLEYSGKGMYDGRYDGEDTIQSIDLSKNTKLKTLILSYISMEGIDLSANLDIEYLTLMQSTSSATSRESGYKGLERLKTLDLSAHTKLKELTVYDHEMESIDLSKNTLLEEIDLHLLSKLNNINLDGADTLDKIRISRCTAISSIDFCDKPLLEYLEAYYDTSLKSIDVSGCPALRTLTLYENELDSIDVSKNTALTSLRVDGNNLTALDLGANVKLNSLRCDNNQLTTLDLTANTALSSTTVSTQTIKIDQITDNLFDLKTLPLGFDISKVRTKNSSGVDYQFITSKNNSSSTYDYVMPSSDLTVNLKGANNCITYEYFVGTLKSKDTYMTVKLEINTKYYTISVGTPGVTLKEFSYSSGAGADITASPVKSGSSKSFVVEVDESSPLFGKKLAVFLQSGEGEKTEVSEYTYNDTTYYATNGISGPTVITVEMGHECIFGSWAPVANTSKHERKCTVEGCDKVESGWCTDHYCKEYHVTISTMQKDCTVCGRANTWEVNTEGSAHVAAADATCSAPGNIEFWLCGHCKKYFTDENCQHEVTPAEVYSNPVRHSYSNGVCEKCGYKVTTARFEQSPTDVFSSDDNYVYVLIGVGKDGKLYAMGEATEDGRRYGVEIPAAQIDENGVVTLSPDQAEFMDFEYYFENGATATSQSSWLVDGGYMSVLNGKIYTYPLSRLDDPNNARPFSFRQKDYGDDSGLGYAYGNVYDKDTNTHTFEYITFNADTLCFEACDEAKFTIYLYRQICDHEDIHVSHTYPVDATCTEQGFSGEYWFCSMCFTYFADAECTTKYIFPDEDTNVSEYFNVPALGHRYSADGVCENCGMLRPVYRPVSSLEEFDRLSEDAYFIIVFKDGEKTYAAYLPREGEFIDEFNVVEVTVAPDGSITIINESVIEFQMMPSGVWGGQTPDFNDPEYTEITEDERVRAMWIPNYWLANDGMMGEWGVSSFMTQNRIFGDHLSPGIIDNRNWKISFNPDGTALLVSTWTEFSDSAALQLVKYTDGDGVERILMVGCYGERWQYSDILSNATIISGAYLYASIPAYKEPEHVCEFGDWTPDPENATRHIRTCECGAVESGEHTFGTPVSKTDMTHSVICPTCGAEEEYDHSFFDWIAKDDREHVHECMECEYESVLPHDYVKEITKEPTEDETGEATYTCSLCSHSYTVELPKKVSEITNEQSDATLSVPAGSNAYVPDGTVFEVVELPAEEVPERVLGEIALEAEGSVKPLAMYDLAMLLDGAEIQPDGKVIITLPPLQYDHGYDKLIVVYIAPDGSYEECPTTQNEDGTVSFETTHFSKYALIGISEEQKVNTGAVVGIIIGAVLILGCGGFFGYRFIIRKKKA